MITLGEETERLARSLAAKLGSTPAEVIHRALEKEAGRSGVATSAAMPRRPDLVRMKAISDECAALPVLDDRTPEEIIGYDDFGVPR